jgi:transcription initiation factor TFIID TATA-box-binding protein
MKQQKSDEGNLSSNHLLIEHHSDNLNSDEDEFGPVVKTNNNRSTPANMMADSSFDASVAAKMLMPHELGAGASANANTTSLVGQHSIHSAFNDLHHGTSSFYHSTASTTAAAATGFNGFHNSTFHNSYSHNGISTTSSFNTLVHQQQPITLSNQHSITTVSATMPPPLILYNQPHQTSSSLYTNTLSNTNVVASRQIQQQQQQKFTEGATESESAESNANDEQQTTTEEAAATEETATEAAVEEEGDEPEIDIVISNVVCAFSVRCHLQLKQIALQGANVEFKRENGMVTMKLRKPYTTASIWSSGELEIYLDNDGY